MSNPIKIAQNKLNETQATLEQLERKYYWLKGYGTGWKPEHYGLSSKEWDDAHAQHYALRVQMIALHKEIVRLKKCARPRRGVSLMAHRG